MINSFYNPVRTYIGEGSLAMLDEIASQANTSDKAILMLIWDKSVLAIEEVQNFINNAKVEVQVHQFIFSNPTIEQLFNTYLSVKNIDCGLVIGIGGGSVIDVAKSLASIQGHEITSQDDLRNFISKKQYDVPVCPWIGVPTTAGTGSEVTSWATIWDPEKNVKYSIDTVKNYAYAAISDAKLLYSMPMSLTVSSALDAILHAVESYWAKATNAITRILAIQAIETIVEALDIFIEEANTQSDYEKFAKGSVFAGLAFSNTRTTACHSMSYPLTMKYNIPHGIAVSYLLLPVMKLNTAKCDMSKLLEAFGVSSVSQLNKKIMYYLTKATNNVKLSDWGAVLDDIDELVAGSMTKGRADNNPVQITESFVRKTFISLM